MPQTRSKTSTISAESQVRTRLWRAAKGRYKEKVVHGTQTEEAESSLKDPPKKENPLSRQVEFESPTMDSATQTQPLPEEPDYRKPCPQCSSILTPLVTPSGLSTSLLLCPRCPPTPLCEQCLFPCLGGTCTNQSCQAISLLLTCDRVKNSTSKVFGCPVFRACPKCHNIIMHAAGCKYVYCTNCKHSFCFICLKTRKECTKDKSKYWSLTCAAPRAARQRFQT